MALRFVASALPLRSLFSFLVARTLGFFFYYEYFISIIYYLFIFWGFFFFIAACASAAGNVCLGRCVVHTHWEASEIFEKKITNSELVNFFFARKIRAQWAESGGLSESAQLPPRGVISHAMPFKCHRLK